MRLLAYMKRERLSDDEMASRIGGCSGSAVKKWKYGERVPPLKRLRRIEIVTGGQVSLSDWDAGPAKAAA